MFEVLLRMKAWKYRRIMPKAIVARLKLIELKEIVDLVGRDLGYIHSILTKTSYQREILEISSRQLNATSLENAFLKNYIRTCQEIKDCSPKDISLMVSAIMKKFEANNVKALLRAKWAKISVDEAMRFIVPAGMMDEIRCRNILERSENISDVVELLSDLEYGLVLKEALNDYEETSVLLPLEAVLDKSIYGQIIKTAEKLRGLDEKIAKTVLGLEVDSINIKVILRGKSFGIGKDQIRHYLLPTSEIFGEKELEIAIEIIDIKRSIEALLTRVKFGIARDYQYMLTDLLNEYVASQSLSQLEMVFDRSLLKTSLRMLKRYTPYFNIGLILAFLNSKWFEVRNLRAIVRGAEDDVPPDKMRKLLILP